MTVHSSCVAVAVVSLISWNAAFADDDFRELKGHEGPTRIGLFTPDGKKMVTCSGWPGGDGTVRIFEIATGKELHVLKGHKENIDCLAMSPDGKFVYSGGGSAEGIARGWDVATGKEILKFEGHTKGQNLSCILVSPDNSMVASGGSQKKLFLWDAKTGKEIRKLEGHTDLVRCLAFTPDGKKLVSGSWDGTCKVWETATGKEIISFKPKTKWVEGLAMMPDGKEVAVACEDFSVWNLETGEKQRSIKSPATCVAISPDGKHLLSGYYDGIVRFLDAENGKRIEEYQAHVGNVHGVSFSHDGQWFSTAGGGEYKNKKEVKGTDFIVRIWPVEK
jgi:WD40 repeat protein